MQVNRSFLRAPARHAAAGLALAANLIAACVPLLHALAHERAGGHGTEHGVVAHVVAKSHARGGGLAIPAVRVSGEQRHAHGAPGSGEHARGHEHTHGEPDSAEHGHPEHGDDAHPDGLHADGLLLPRYAPDPALPLPAEPAFPEFGETSAHSLHSTTGTLRARAPPAATLARAPPTV